MSGPATRIAPSRAVAALVAALALGLPSAAAGHAAHDDDIVPAGASTSTLRQIEDVLLGADHANEHAISRRLARRAERGELPESPTGARTALSSEGVAAPEVAAPASQVGEWTTGPFQLPNYAIHSVVLPTGKVLFWGRPPLPEGGGVRPNYSEAALWDPTLGTGPGSFTDVDPPVVDVDGPGGQDPIKAPVFCSGQTLLADGQVLAAGGTKAYAGTLTDDEYTDWAGLPMIFTFNPWTESWTRQPDMEQGRWYPGQVLLPDGRTVILSGLGDEPPGGLMTNSVEVFNPPATLGGQGTVTQQPSALRNGLGLYPRTFTFGDDVIVTGPSKALTATLDTTSFTWDESLQTMSRSRIAGNAVRRAGGPAGSDTITTLGGFDRNLDPGPFYPAATGTETIDARSDNATWETDAPLNIGRANGNAVMLPDGSMAMVGGGSGYMLGGDPELGAAGGYITYADGRARQVEVYDSASESWLLGPAQQEDRTYHSTAVLLPDGRVLSAGDDHNPKEPDGAFSLTDNGEIYSPPYLFRGARPVIADAPLSVGFGDAFAIESESPNLDRAVLMAPGTTTHAFDMNQRHVELRVLDSHAGQGVDVVAPPSTDVAPPGYYMLFLINEDGVPSEAAWVSLDPTAPDRPTIGAPPAPPTGDFNGDGLVDRAIGAPDEDVGSAADAGAVNVVYGSVTGFDDEGGRLFTQEGLGGQAAESGDRFGAALAGGDFDGDGYADLAVGAPGEDLGSAVDAGAVGVLYGSADGLSGDGAASVDQNGAGILDAAESGDRLGAALTTGDLDGDGDDDLAAGAPGEAVGSVAGAGAANVLYGSPAGLGSTDNEIWHQNSVSIAEAAETNDAFASALAAGDFNGDGRDDLVAGAPSETVGTAVAGAANVIYGSGAGLTATGNQLWQQNSGGIEDTAEAGDAFASALAAGDFNNDGRDDLGIGAPTETVGTTVAGATNVIYGSAAGLASAGDQIWHQNSAAILEAVEAEDRMGAALAAGDLDGDGADDLAVGVPGEAVGGAAGAGAANVLLGSPTGLGSTGNQLWTQNNVGVSDVAEAGDSFGEAIGAGDLNADGSADLTIGVPGETTGTVAGGATNLLLGSAAGPTATASKLWTQEGGGILEPVEAGDSFGAAIGISPSP